MVRSTLNRISPGTSAKRDESQPGVTTLFCSWLARPTPH